MVGHHIWILGRTPPVKNSKPRISHKMQTHWINIATKMASWNNINSGILKWHKNRGMTLKTVWDLPAADSGLCKLKLVDDGAKRSNNFTSRLGGEESMSSPSQIDGAGCNSGCIESIRFGVWQKNNLLICLQKRYEPLTIWLLLWWQVLNGTWLRCLYAKTGTEKCCDPEIWRVEKLVCQKFWVGVHCQKEQ